MDTKFVMNVKYIILLVFLLFFGNQIIAVQLPEGFVYIKDIIPNISIDLRYYSNNNFIGRRINGYEKNECIATKKATEALKNVQDDLQEFGLELLIYDAYRPQRAVDEFVAWAKDLKDTKMKADFYPAVKKNNLFKDEYIAEKSSHSRGSTFDLTHLCFFRV